MMWPFILQNEIGKLGRNFPLATFGSERVKFFTLRSRCVWCENYQNQVVFGLPLALRPWSLQPSAVIYSFSPFTGVAMDPIWLWASRRLWPQRRHIGLYSSHPVSLMVSETCGFLQCRVVSPTPNPSTCSWVALPRVWVSKRKPSHHNKVVTPSRQR